MLAQEKVGGDDGDCHTVGLGRIHSSLILSGPADGLILLPDEGVKARTCRCQVRQSLPVPGFYGRTLSRTVPARHA
jgi:hypothetical protein